MSFPCGKLVRHSILIKVCMDGSISAFENGFGLRVTGHERLIAFKSCLLEATQFAAAT